MILGCRLAAGVLLVPWLFAGGVPDPALSFDKNAPYFREGQLDVGFQTGDGGFHVNG